MGTWRKWAGFGVWCVVLFGGMILAGTGLWPLGAAAAAVGAVGLVLWGRRYTAVFVCPACGAELSGQDFRSSKWSLNVSRRGMPQKRVIKKCPVLRTLFL